MLEHKINGMVLQKIYLQGLTINFWEKENNVEKDGITT